MTNQFSSERKWFMATVLLWLIVAAAWFITRSDYGMSWDEITRWNSGDSKLRYLERLLDEGWSAWGSAKGTDLYPGLFDLPLAIYAKYVGGDRAEASHLYSIFFAVMAVIGAGVLGRKIGGWRLAFWASLLLAVLPRFYGHAVFNPKDIPFAATYTWGLWGVLYVADSLQHGAWRHWLLAGFLAGLAMATRLPGMIILAYLFGLVVYFVFSQSAPSNGQHWRLPARRQCLVGFSGLMVACGIAYCILMLFFPTSHRNPFADSVHVVGRLHDFSKAIPVVFRGGIYTAGTTPWYYTPWMLAITTPAWQLGLLLCGATLVIWRTATAFRQGKWWNLKIINSGTVLLGFGFPLLYLLITQPAIHNGSRHFLFVIPAGAVLMALALCSLVDLLIERKGLKPVIIYGCFTLAVAYNVSVLVRLHPYQYVYLNNVAGGPAAGLGYYETEYWFTSMREGIERLQQWRIDNGLPPESVRVLMTGPRSIAEYQLPEGWVLVNPGEPADYFLGNTQFSGDLLVDGQEIITIERMGLPILVVKDMRPSTD